MEIASRPARAWSGRVADFAAALRDGVAHGIRTLCVMRAPGSAERLSEILSEYRLHPALHTGGVPDVEEIPANGGLFVRVAGLRHGFEFPNQALVVVAERDVFGEESKGPERKTRSRAAFISDFRDLRLGDFVVHVDHGIARYAGLGRPKGGSLNRDFMILEFAAGDRLFVPTDRLDLVQKYAGVGGGKPSVDKLGGPGWERVKARVRLLFLPFGLLYTLRGLGGKSFSPGLLMLMAFTLSFGIEYYQVYCHNRSTSLLDLLDNVLGAYIGMRVGEMYLRKKAAEVMEPAT